MSRRLVLNLLIASASLLLSLGVAEVVLRALGAVDADGNCTMCGHLRLTFQMPITATREHVRDYTRAGAGTALMYDPLLGWAPRPGAHSRDGLYRYNSQSIRAPIEYTVVPAEGTIRIALFGDSFVHGDEVSYEQTWGYFLERQLRAAGFNVEVLNFGVSGYGTDQAFLRWRALGKTFSPHIVIQGLFMENVRRNVNLVRPIYLAATGIPLSKPRFILEGEQLALINVPPIPPERLAATIADFQSWDLARYEYFFRPELLRHTWWMNSHALVFFHQRVLARNDAWFSYDVRDEPARVTLRILQQFRQEAQAAGSQFMAVYLPDTSEVVHAMHADPLRFGDLLARIGEQIDLIDPAARLAASAGQSSVRDLFQRTHYSAKANTLIADVIAAHLQADLQRISRGTAPE